MAYVSYLAPEEFDRWVLERQQKLARELGVAVTSKKVSKTSILRQLPAIVDEAEALGIRPAATVRTVAA